MSDADKNAVVEKTIGDTLDGHATKAKLAALRHKIRATIVQSENTLLSTFKSHLRGKLHDDHTADQQLGCRHRVLKVLESTKFELLITFLVLLELIFVIVEVTISHTLTCEHGSSSHRRHLSKALAVSEDNSMCPHWERSCTASHTIRYLSLTLLFFFLTELLLKFILAPRLFVSHVGHIVDITVVVISITFELFLYEAEVEALIVLRAWRCVRIAHGVYEEFHVFHHHEHLLRESENALHVSLTFIEKKELRDEFRSFCLSAASSSSSEPAKDGNVVTAQMPASTCSATE